MPTTVRPTGIPSCARRRPGRPLRPLLRAMPGFTTNDGRRGDNSRLGFLRCPRRAPDRTSGEQRGQSIQPVAVGYLMLPPDNAIAHPGESRCDPSVELCLGAPTEHHIRASGHAAGCSGRRIALPAARGCRSLPAGITAVGIPRSDTSSTKGPGLRKLTVGSSSSLSTWDSRSRSICSAPPRRSPQGVTMETRSGTSPRESPSGTAGKQRPSRICPHRAAVQRAQWSHEQLR